MDRRMRRQIMHPAFILSVIAAGLPTVAGFAGYVMCPRLSVTNQNQHYYASRRQSATLVAVNKGRGGEYDCMTPNSGNNTPQLSEFNRRDAISQACLIAASTIASSTSTIFTNPSTAYANDIEGVANIPRSTSPPTFTSKTEGGKSVTVFKTKSGLQYIDLVEGSGSTPKYGNFVTIAYKAYVKLPDAKGKSYDLDEFDSESQYLIKHGNGRTVPGLDEGLHTMKIGGKRRIIVPPKLGYVTSGIGPIPSGPYGRWKLNRLIDKMVELRGGNVIFDVEMRGIMEDEADQGYYDDESLSPEDFNTLRQNIEASQQAARGA